MPYFEEPEPQPLGGSQPFVSDKGGRIAAHMAPPFEFILAEMKAREWNVRDFQRCTKLEWELVAGLLQGVIPINEYIAARLMVGTEVSSEFWLNLQHNYDRWLTLKEQANERQSRP